MGLSPRDVGDLTLYEYGCLIDGANLRAQEVEDKPPVMSEERFDELMRD